MKKVVVKLDLHDDRGKQKALKTVSSLPGIDSISMDMKEKKLTVIGSVDPVNLVSKLRKYWQTDIVSVGPAKEPEKKEEVKKEEEPKKEGSEEKKPLAEEPKEDDKEKKNEEGKKKKEEEEPKKPPPLPMIMPMPHPAYWQMPPPEPRVMAYRAPYNPTMTNYYYAPQTMEDNPNACVIL